MTNRTIQNIAFIFLIVSIAVFVLHFLFFRHSFPPVNTDEGSFFSPAQSFAQKGNLASDIHQNFLPGGAFYTYWMPPLYIVFLGSVFKIFGSTVVVAKLVSMLLTIASALLLASLAKNKYEQWCAAALFLICPFILITSAFIRVEALAIFLTVLAIVAVWKEWPVYILGGIAALGVMTHPLMLAFGAGLALTALRRGIKPLLIFSLAFAVVIAPYIWYIFQDVALYKEQMTLQFLRKSKAKFFDLKLSYVVQSLPLVLVALFCLYKVRNHKEIKIFLAVSVVLALLVVLKSNEFNYQVYTMPYVLAAVLLVMEEKRATGLYYYGLPLLLFGFFALILFSKLSKYHFRTDGTYKQLITYLDSKKTWTGKHIFERGGPDLSTYLLMNDQAVERQIPVPEQLPKNWFDKYDYVIDVRDNIDAPNNDSAVIEPWSNWQQDSFTTSNGAYTIREFIKP